MNELDQFERDKMKTEGQKFLDLIESKGYSGYSFAKKAMYSNSRLYKIIRGECDITNIKVYNALSFARVLGFATIDEMYEALGVDILRDLI